MLDGKVYDCYAMDFVEMPPEMKSFLEDIETACRKHGLSLAHEDFQGGFLVELLKEENLRWVAGAAKNYDQKDLSMEVLRWITQSWGSHICPYCRAGEVDDYIGKPYKYCPDCGQRVDPPLKSDSQDAEESVASLPAGIYTLSNLLMDNSGERTKVKLYECRYSIIGDGAPYPWPEEDLITSAPAITAYLDRIVHRWEVVDDYLCAVVGFIKGDYEKHY